MASEVGATLKEEPVALFPDLLKFISDVTGIHHKK